MFQPKELNLAIAARPSRRNCLRPRSCILRRRSLPPSETAVGEITSLEPPEAFGMDMLMLGSQIFSTTRYLCFVVEMASHSALCLAEACAEQPAHPSPRMATGLPQASSYMKTAGPDSGYWFRLFSGLGQKMN